MEAATHMADTLYQGNPEMGPLMTQELGRMEQTLAHRVVQQYPAAGLTKAHSHTTPLTPPPWRKRVWHSQRVLASNQVEPERRRPEVHAGHFTWGSSTPHRANSVRRGLIHAGDYYGSGPSGHSHADQVSHHRGDGIVHVDPARHIEYGVLVATSSYKPEISESTAGPGRRLTA